MIIATLLIFILITVVLGNTEDIDYANYFGGIVALFVSYMLAHVLVFEIIQSNGAG